MGPTRYVILKRNNKNRSEAELKQDLDILYYCFGNYSDSVFNGARGEEITNPKRWRFDSDVVAQMKKCLTGYFKDDSWTSSSPDANGENCAPPPAAIKPAQEGCDPTCQDLMYSRFALFSNQDYVARNHCAAALNEWSD